LFHIERAYRDALALALGVGLVVSLLAAGLVTWSLARRLRQALSGLTSAVDELSRGHYSTRVPSVGAGTELDSLAATLNDMAARLDAVEENRRRPRRRPQPPSGPPSAADALARGHSSTRVPAVGAGTELDSRAATLNDMAARLDAVEENRRRLLSDLAHELRTPIATLAAHHEAMADATIEPEAAMPILASQTMRLSRLADDISEVSQAEEGQLP